jgi:hypothetical protein
LNALNATAGKSQNCFRVLHQRCLHQIVPHRIFARHRLPKNTNVQITAAVTNENFSYKFLSCNICLIFGIYLHARRRQRIKAQSRQIFYIAVFNRIFIGIAVFGLFCIHHCFIHHL